MHVYDKCIATISNKIEKSIILAQLNRYHENAVQSSK